MSNLQSMGAGALEGAGSRVKFGSDGLAYLARQPILDGQGAVFGYELHFHEVADAPVRADAEASADGLAEDSRGVLDALALYGIERFTGSAWGFVPCSLDVLATDLFEGLPPSQTVIEIPRCDSIPPSLTRKCFRLREIGFRLSLSDYQPGDSRQSLLPLAHFVKVRIETFDSPSWSTLCTHVNRAGACLIADEIHSHEAYRKARTSKAKYFQGFYFCSPELLPNGATPAYHGHHLQLLHELFKDPLDLKTLCPLVGRDPSLVYRVLRFVNSPMCAVRNPVTSMESAILILGDATFRRIATLAIQCTLSQGRWPELPRMAQIRARFCAQAAGMCGLATDEMYLLGMLSLLPAMLQVPMQNILPNLPLRREICQALAGAPVRERLLLAWIEALEANDIAECEEIAAKRSLDKNKLAQLYLDAVSEVTHDAAIA